MSIPRISLHVAVVALFAFAGGFAAQTLMGSSAARAQYEIQDQSTGAAITSVTPPAPNYLELRDGKNKKGITTYVMDGQPGQIFYGENGQMRLQMGTYSAKGERGLPLFGLSDTQGKLRLLFRLAGKNESPVIIMKDTNGRDRLVMGLDIDKPSQEPFLVVKDITGKGVDFISGEAVKK